MHFDGVFMLLGEIPKQVIEVIEELLQRNDYSREEKEIILFLQKNYKDPGLINTFKYINELFLKHKCLNVKTQWQYFLMLLVDMAFFYNKKSVNEYKDHKNILSTKVKQIADAADKLALLMNDADDIGLKWGYSRPFDKCPLELLLKTAESMRKSSDESLQSIGNRFDMHVEPGLRHAITLDNRYIPSTVDFVLEIAKTARNEKIEPDYLTISMEGQNHKYNQFVKRFFWELRGGCINKRITPHIETIPSKNWVIIFSILFNDDDFTENFLR